MSGANQDPNEQDTRNIKYVYIGRTDDVAPFEKIAGPIKNALNWEATKLGLHVEVYLSSEEVERVRALDSITVYDRVQHVLTDHDRRIHDMMLWSKRAVTASGNRQP